MIRSSLNLRSLALEVKCALEWSAEVDVGGSQNSFCSPHWICESVRVTCSPSSFIGPLSIVPLATSSLISELALHPHKITTREKAATRAPREVTMLLLFSHLAAVLVKLRQLLDAPSLRVTAGAEWLGSAAIGGQCLGASSKRPCISAMAR